MDILPYMAEIELLEAAYSVSQVEYVADSISCQVDLSIRETKVRLTIPFSFPDQPIRYNIDGQITNAEKNNLMTKLQSLTSINPEFGAIAICQEAQELLNNIIEVAQNDSIKISVPSTQKLVHHKICIGRFLIYFHHIKSEWKRKTIREAASHFNLGGFSKIGYPGICVVEGFLDDILGFVREIQQLRWKHMVVRGEECETLYESTIPKSYQDVIHIINNARLLPAFSEIESMDDAGNICNTCGLHDLFMTSMKKY